MIWWRLSTPDGGRYVQFRCDRAEDLRGALIDRLLDLRLATCWRVDGCWVGPPALLAVQTPQGWVTVVEDGRAVRVGVGQELGFARRSREWWLRAAAVLSHCAV